MREFKNSDPVFLKEVSFVPRISLFRFDKKTRGQSMVEFALICPLLILLLLSLFDFSFYWFANINTSQAAQNAARFAATHPTAWSAVTPPATGSIESYVMVFDQADNTIANNNTDISIQYYSTTTAPYTLCGQYSVSSGAFVAQTGYTQATCVIPGNEIKVTVTSLYMPVTPDAHMLFGKSGGITLSEYAYALEEQ